MASFFSSFRNLATRWRPFLGSLLIIVFMAVLAAFAAYQSRLNYEEQARISANNLSQVVGNHIASAIEKIDLSLSTIPVEALQQDDQGEIDSRNLNRLLAEQKLLLPDVSYLLATDSVGILRFGPTGVTNRQIVISDRDYFRQLRNDSRRGLVITGPYRSRVNNEWGMVLARRLSRRDGTFAGGVGVSIDSTHFEKMLSSLNLGPHGMAYLGTADLTSIARIPKLESIGGSASKWVSPESLELLQAAPEEGTFFATNPADGILRSIAFRKLKGYPLYVAVGLAQQDYLGPWWREVIQLAAIVIVFSLVILWLSRGSIRAANQLQATHRLLQEAVENSAVGFSIFDSQQRLLVCNEIVRGFYPELRDVLKPGVKLEYLLQTGVMRGKYVEAQEGTEQWMGARVRSHQAANGQPFEQTLNDGRQLLIIENQTPSGHVVSNYIDVTELNQYRQQLERLVENRTQELKAALDQFRILVELSPTALAMFDKDLKYLATSRQWIKLHGKGHSHLLGKHMYEASPDFPERWEAVHHAALAGVIDSREEDLWVQADGSERWVRWWVCPWTGGSKNDGGIIISTEDITDRKQAEQRLLAREADFRATFEQAGVGVFHAAMDGQFLRVNDKYCSILGYEREELLGLRYQDVTYPEDLDAHLGGITRLLSGTNGSSSLEKRYIRKDGAVIWVNLTIALVRKPNGEPDYTLAVIEDIHQRKEVECTLAAERESRQALLEQEVAKRTEELQAANRQLEGFVYASSHDLRGPLGRISSFSTLLENNYRDRLEGDGLLFLDFIRSNALRLTTLIDDLMAHARVDQRAISLQPVDVRSAVQSALKEKAEDIREVGAVVRLALPTVQVLADANDLSQVLHNLLENALKYSTEVAEPVIEIGGEEIDGRVRLWVRDNGIGFDMEYHEKIFEIFRRLHTHTEYAGSGVGLALVKRAMERIGGKVWAEGQLGRGATFYLEVKVAPQFVEG